MWKRWTALLALVLIALRLEIGVETTALDKPQFLDWMRNLRQSKGVGLFAILLAGHSDRAAGEVVDDPACREDIARYSAEDCWFLYFTREGDARARSPQQQHAAGVHEVVRWLDLDIGDMPCLVFFERPEYDHYLTIPLGGLSKDQIVVEVRAIFNHVREEKRKPGYSTYRAVQSYKSARERQAAGRSLFDFVYQTSLQFAALVVAQTN